MCEYCEKEKELSLNFESAVSKKEDEMVLSERIVDNKIFILANLGFLDNKGKTKYRSTLSKIKINYCPMCGRKLGDEDK